MKSRSTQSSALTFLLLLVFILAPTQQSEPQYFQSPSHKVLKLDPQQTLHLSLQSNIKILLGKSKQSLLSGSSKEQSKTKAKMHSLDFVADHEILQVGEAKQINKKEWTISITLAFVAGSARAYFSPINGFGTSNQQHIRKNSQSQFSQDNYEQFVRKQFQIFQGHNIITSNHLSSYLSKNNLDQNIAFSKFCIIIIVKQQEQKNDQIQEKVKSKIVIKYDSPKYQIQTIKMEQTTDIALSALDTEYRIYKLLINTPEKFKVRFNKKAGYPSVKLYECPKGVNCWYHPNNIPQVPTTPVTSHQAPSKLHLQPMLLKTQQYIGTLSSQSQIFVQLAAYSQIETEISILVHSSNYTILLSENQIIKDFIRDDFVYRYQLEVAKGNQEGARVTVQVFEGQVFISVRQEGGTDGWQYSPTQTSGVITFQIPSQRTTDKYTKSKYKSSTQKTSQIQKYIIQISTSQNKDASYSIVYSSGEYKIYINDGYPSSHIIKQSQNIRLFYKNEQLRDTPIYLSFNIKDPQQINFLSLKIYYFQQKKREQYSPVKQIYQSINYAKSVVMKIPGNYSKFQLIFFNSGRDQIEITITINDEQIIFLPLGHAMPLQVNKDGDVSLLVYNNQEGHIQLILKKCDESYPKIAYAFDSNDFANKVYNYQSMEQNQRIFISNIKVKKGGKLYIRVEGDEMTDSFVQITANYITPKSKSIAQNKVRKGNQGQINYQLITNSKAQIWFQQLQCEQQCKNNAKYELFWSTSKSDMYRHMICPGSFVYKGVDDGGQKIKTQSYVIPTKPGRDGIVAFNHILDNPVIYINIKAITHHQSSQKQQTNSIIYNDIEIINIEGQISRISLHMLAVSGAVVIFVAVMLIFIVRRQTYRGYKPVKTFQSKKSSNIQENKVI